MLPEHPAQFHAALLAGERQRRSTSVPVEREKRIDQAVVPRNAVCMDIFLTPRNQDLERIQSRIQKELECLRDRGFTRAVHAGKQVDPAQTGNQQAAKPLEILEGEL
jgi:hypothetical protein